MAGFLGRCVEAAFLMAGVGIGMLVHFKRQNPKQAQALGKIVKLFLRLRF